MYNLQVKALKNTKACINTEMSSTKKAYEEINISTYPIHLPIVYPFENNDKDSFSQNLKSVIKKIDSIDTPFIVLSHARHLWVKPKKFDKDNWRFISKNNDWLIYAYKRFLDSRPTSNAFLILFEYGKDYLETKKLCRQEKIDDKVLWVPIMPRKEILYLIKNSFVGIGEFYEK